MHRDVIMNTTNKMQLYRLIYFSLLALHVSGDVFAHHQEYLTVFTAVQFQLIQDTSWQLLG
jgi:hypothetical protein